MGRKCFYSVLVLAVLAVAGISVYLCVSGKNNDDNNNSDNSNNGDELSSGFNVRGDAGASDADQRDEAEPQSMLITYESGDSLSAECHEFLVEQAAAGAARRRRRLNESHAVDEAADAALSAIETLLASLNAPPTASARNSAVSISPTLLEQAEQAAIDLLSDMQEPADATATGAASLVRTAVAPSVWAALTDRVSSSSSSLSGAAAGFAAGASVQVSSERRSFEAFDEDQITVSRVSVEGRRLDAESSSESLAAARWLKKVDIDVLRMTSPTVASAENAIALVEAIPCVASAEADALVPIEDPPEQNVRAADGSATTATGQQQLRRLFSFNDMLDSAKDAFKSAGDWVVGNFPDEVAAAKAAFEATKETFGSAAQKAKGGWESLVETLEPHFKSAWGAITDLGDKAGNEIAKAIEKAKAQMEPGSEADVALDSLAANVQATIEEWQGAMAKAINEAQREEKERQQERPAELVNAVQPQGELQRSVEPQAAEDMFVQEVLNDAADSMADLLVDTERRIQAITRTAAAKAQRNTRGGIVAVPHAEDSDDQHWTPDATEVLAPTGDEEDDDQYDYNVVRAGGKTNVISSGVRRRLGDQEPREGKDEEATVSALLMGVFGAATKAALSGAQTLAGSSSPRAAVAKVSATAPSPNDVLYNQQWSLGVVDVHTAFQLANAANTKGGEIIAILDTGCDLAHEDLRNRLWSNEGEVCDDGIDNDNNGYVDDCHGYNFYNHNTDLVEKKVHGTGVGGAALAEVGNRVGVASACDRCRLMCLRVGTTGFSTAAFAEAVNYLLMMGVRVMNYSGNGGRSNNQEQALLRAAEEDVAIVVSSGNSACDLDSTDACVAQGYPARLDNDNIIAVGASTASNSSASYSSYGSKAVDVYAPAGDILPQPGNTYKNISGTSFSSPVVAGLVGLIRATFPQLTTAQVKEAIVSTCYQQQQLTNKSLCKGIVDFAAALTAASRMAGAAL